MSEYRWAKYRLLICAKLEVKAHFQVIEAAHQPIKIVAIYHQGLETSCN